MNLAPSGRHPRGRTSRKRARYFGVGAIGVAIGTILTAGGRAGVDDGIIGLALVVFGILATLALGAGLVSAWLDISGSSAAPSQQVQNKTPSESRKRRPRRL